MKIDGLLLDTCFVLWLSSEQPVARSAVEKVKRVRKAGGAIAVSVMTAWEIGMLVSKGRLPYIKSPLQWFERFVSGAQVQIEDVNSEVLIESSFLPGPIHNDPTDRILVATARSRDFAIVTRDRPILAYGVAGFVKTVPC